jgi:uncharacterized membrane protein
VLTPRSVSRLANRIRTEAVRCLSVQVVVGALTIVAGVALAVAGGLGWRGVLPRNRFVGVRTADTMASDEAFRLANRVAGPVLVAAGAVAVLGGSAVLAARSTAAFAVILGVLVPGVLGLTLAGGVLGTRAAAAAAAGAVTAGAVTAGAATAPAACAGCVCGGRSCAR